MLSRCFSLILAIAELFWEQDKGFVESAQEPHLCYPGVLHRSYFRKPQHLRLIPIPDSEQVQAGVQVVQWQ